MHIDFKSDLISFGTCTSYLFFFFFFHYFFGSAFFYYFFFALSVPQMGDLSALRTPLPRVRDHPSLRLPDPFYFWLPAAFPILKVVRFLKRLVPICSTCILIVRLSCLTM